MIGAASHTTAVVTRACVVVVLRVRIYIIAVAVYATGKARVRCAVVAWNACYVKNIAV